MVSAYGGGAPQARPQAQPAGKEEHQADQTQHHDVGQVGGGTVSVEGVGAV